MSEGLRSRKNRNHNGRGLVLESKIDLGLERTPGEGVKRKKFLKCGGG